MKNYRLSHRIELANGKVQQNISNVFHLRDAKKLLIEKKKQFDAAPFTEDFFHCSQLLLKGHYLIMVSGTKGTTSDSQIETYSIF